MLGSPPSTVAVVGASMRNFYTRWCIDNLLRYRYPGRILPVNRRGEAVVGLGAYTSIEELPGPVDLGVIGVPAAGCLDIARQLAGKGCTTLVVLSDGFGETGEPAGIEAERQLSSWCRSAGVTLVGPNGVGYADFGAALACIGEPIPADVEPGPVSVLSQSGGLLASLLAGLALEGTGVDLAVSIGNGAGVDLLAALEGALDRPGTEVVCAYAEGFGADSARLRAVLGKVAAGGKRVLVVKPGRTAAAQRLVSSHTASLAGPDAVVRSLLGDSGVGVFDSLEHMVRACRLALHVPGRSRPSAAGGGGPGGIAVLGSSGGAASVTSDMAASFGVPLAVYGESTVEAIRRLVPASGHVGNPIDLSGRSVGAAVDTAQVYETIAGDPSVEVLLLPFSAIVPDDSAERASHRDYLELLAGISDRRQVPLVVSTVAAQVINPWLRDLERRHPGVAVVAGLDATMAALGVLLCDGGGRSVPGFGGAPGADGVRAGPGDGGGGPAPAHTHTNGSLLDEAAGRGLLAAAGFPLVPGRRCRTEAEVAAAVAALGLPVVVKGIVPGVAHKSALGAVVTGAVSAEEAVAAAAAIRRRLAAAGRTPDGFLVERMVSGMELLVGLTRDAVYGPAVTVGLGGALAEVTPLHATAALPLPAPDGPARLLAAAGLGPAVAGSGAAAAVFGRHLEALCHSFVAGALAAYDTVEINPVFLASDGAVWAADALVVAPPGATRGG